MIDGLGKNEKKSLTDDDVPMNNANLFSFCKSKIDFSNINILILVRAY